MTRLAAIVRHLPDFLMGVATILIVYGIGAGIGQVGVVV